MKYLEILKGSLPALTATGRISDDPRNPHYSASYHMQMNSVREWEKLGFADLNNYYNKEISISS